MKLEKELTYDKPEVELGKDWKEGIITSEENLKHLLELEKKAQEKHQLLGGVFDVPVADGRVFYQVVEVNKSTAKVKRCAGICLDQYVDEILGYEFNLPLSKTAQLVNTKRLMNKLFNKKN